MANKVKDKHTVKENAFLLNISNKAPKTYEQFCHSSYNIYSRLQQWKNQITTIFPLSEYITNDQQKNEISEFSGDYLDLIQLYIDNLSSDDDQAANRFNLILHTWSFCDILYLSGSIQQLDFNRLRDWLNIYYNDDSLDDEENGIDWDYVRRKLLRGDKLAVINQLKGYSNMENCLLKDEINKLIDLVKAIPELAMDKDELKYDWEKKWASWHQMTEELYDSFFNSGLMNEEDNDDAIELRFTMNILLGDQTSISEAGTFLEKCIGTLLYTNPLQHNNDLAIIASFYYLPEEDDSDQIVNMCYALLVQDFDMFIDLMDDDIWYQTHLGYLLLVSGQFSTTITYNDEDTYKNEEVITEPIFYVIEQYAHTIAEEYKMWIEAMEYLMACKINKEIWIEKLFDLSTFPSDDIEFLKSLVEFCKNSKLPHVEKTLYRIIAQKYENREEYVHAAINYGLAEDVVSLDTMGNKLLDIYLSKGELKDVVTDNNLKILDKSKPYFFFRSYHDFKTNLNKNKFEDAYEKLMGLFTLVDHNSNYKSVLLVDSIQIQKDCRRMTEQNTHELLQLVESISQNSVQQSFIATYYNRCNSSASLDSDVILAKIHERLTFNLCVFALQL
ncbi:unnamed protein product [Cunninghamella blakesleeana]